MRGFPRRLVILFAALSVTTPAMAWEWAKGTSYLAVGECPNPDSICVFVGCASKGQLSFELMLYEHGLADGAPLSLRVDKRNFVLNLPPSGVDELYRWPLTPDLARALVSARTASIQTEAGMRPFPISLRGAARRIGEVIRACGGLPLKGPDAAPAFDTATPSLAPAIAGSPSVISAAAAPPAAPLSSRQASSGRNLSDLIQTEPYRETFRIMAETGTDTWLKRAPARVESASTIETIEGQALERFNVCMAHACDEYAADVLFLADGSAAFAAVRERDHLVLLGDPAPAVAARLTAFYPDLPLPPAAPASFRQAATAQPRGLPSAAEPIAQASSPVITPLRGLSTDQGCAEADFDGVIVSRRLRKGDREVEGFDFKDKHGPSYVNVDLPDRLSRAKKAELHARLIGILTAGARLRLKIKGCGASGSFQVLDGVGPAR